MTKLGIVDAPLSVFDEARAQLDAWEKDYPDADPVGLVLDAPDEMEVAMAGPPQKSSANAGLYFMAAQVALEP